MLNCCCFHRVHSGPSAELLLAIAYQIMACVPSESLHHPSRSIFAASVV